MTHKYSNGAFAFVRFSESRVVASDPATVREQAADLGLPQEIVPAYVGDRMTVSRAIQAKSSWLRRSQGYLLTRIKSQKNEMVCTISDEQKDSENNKVEHTQVSTLVWQESAPESIQGDHPAAQAINAEYQRLRGKLCPYDWSGTLTSYLTDHCAAVPMRSDGRIYWIPPQHVGKLKDIKPFLRSVGLSLTLPEIEGSPEALDDVKDAATDSLAADLEALQVEVDSWDGTQRPSTYTKRIEKFQELKARAQLYEAALGLAVEQTTEILENLERKADEMLEIRSNVRIKHDGTVVDL